MINFGSLSILLIHRELLSDGIRLINAVSTAFQAGANKEDL